MKVIEILVFCFIIITIVIINTIGRFNMNSLSTIERYGTVTNINSIEIISSSMTITHCLNYTVRHNMSSIITPCDCEYSFINEFNVCVSRKSIGDNLKFYYNFKTNNYIFDYLELLNFHYIIIRNVFILYTACFILSITLIVGISQIIYEISDEPRKRTVEAPKRASDETPKRASDEAPKRAMEAPKRVEETPTSVPPLTRSQKRKKRNKTR